MTRIFLYGMDKEARTLTLTGKDSVHVASALRMCPGEPIVICDGAGTDAECEIESAAPERTVCRVLRIKPSPSELPVRIHLYQSLPKGDKMEFIIQKTTELGVSRIIPVLSDRCISRPDNKAFEKKLVRYRDICREAAQQCGRGVIPEIAGMTSFSNAVASLPDGAVKIFCNEDEKVIHIKAALRGIKSGDVHVFIGPEGGYSGAEKARAKDAGMISVTFGERILRCETAPVYVCSVMSYEFG
ncbi:MAG: 16S rRNA (uracil(1498)-N(3))-methyltransferase [Clostridia bacterium]|nr:16S rRNA (uracil(1498)-N(3))-methyltransferase [Clostridia bacterium]